MLIRERFISKCPFCEKGDYINWLHGNCKGRLMISIDGDLKCDCCNTSFNIMNARFSCKDHTIDYNLGSRLTKNIILRILDNSGMEPYFLNKLIKRILTYEIE